jgi:3-oxoacyl-[acyl-carrier-protein] synthase III
MQRLREAFITGTGAFLPGEPVTNDRMEDFIGCIGGRKSSAGQRALRWNGIDRRHYALTPAGEPLHSNASRSAAAVVTALQDAGLGRESLQFLATRRPRATSWCRATAAPSMANWVAAHWNSPAFNRSASLR